MRTLSSYQVKRNEKLKKKTFNILGNKCVDCGIDDPLVLSVDHIKPIGNRRKSTVSVWSEIIRNPEKAKEKYQLLCRNCNWRKMILNNERESANTTPFAYSIEVGELRERVKKNTVAIRKLQGLNIESHANSTKKDDEELTKMIYQFKDKITNDRGRLSAKRIRVVFMHELGMKVGHNRAYTIKELLQLTHPNEFT